MPGKLLQMAYRLGERMGLLRSSVVATVDYEVTWPFDEDDEDCGEYTETITFYLLEYPSGMRDFKVHQYGKCAELDYFDVYMRDVLLWMYGGQLPQPAERVTKKAEVVCFTVISGQKAEPPQPSE